MLFHLLVVVRRKRKESGFIHCSQILCKAYIAVTFPVRRTDQYSWRGLFKPAINNQQPSIID